MNKQICRSCGNEMVTESIVPMTFCTNCGASLNYQTAENFVVHRPVAGRGPARYGRGEKMFFAALIGIPVLLIVGGIGAFVFLFYAASQIEPRGPRFATPYSSPSRTNPSPNRSGNQLLSFGAEGLGEGQFKNARAIALDRAGNIYVGDGAMRIQKFDSEGKFLQTWTVRETPETVNENYSIGITRLAIDSKNVLYAAVAGKHLVRYDTNGKFIDKIPLYGEKWMNKQMEARILDMKMLPDDKLAVYATSFPDGEYLMLVSSDGKSEIKHKDLIKKQSSGPGSLTNITMGIGPTGDIFLLHQQIAVEKPYIYRFKSDGSYVDRFTWGDNSKYTFNWSKAMTLNSQGEIFAFNSGKKQIDVLSVEGVVTRSFPVDATTLEEIVVDAAGNAFVLKRDKVEKYASAVK